MLKQINTWNNFHRSNLMHLNLKLNVKTIFNLYVAKPGEATSVLQTCLEIYSMNAYSQTLSEAAICLFIYKPPLIKC